MSDIILKNAPYPDLDIDVVIDTTLLTLSKSSARIYSQTYQKRTHLQSDVSELALLV
ncbi:MAG: hypothetical protein AAFV98_22215 [Chloroflexota bacterium]